VGIVRLVDKVIEFGELPPVLSDRGHKARHNCDFGLHRVEAREGLIQGVKGGADCSTVN
jgi:hypothetical protein